MKSTKLRCQKINEIFNEIVQNNVDFIYSQEKTMNASRKLMPYRWTVLVYVLITVIILLLHPGLLKTHWYSILHYSSCDS